MVLIEAQGPRTVALGILLSFYLDFILVFPYFRFRSVLPNLQASSGKLSEALRATQRQLYWRYIESLLALRRFLRLKAKRGAFAAPIGEFAAPIITFSWIFHICHASPISGVRIVAPIVLAQHKDNERIGKARTTIRSTSPIVIEIP